MRRDCSRLAGGLVAGLAAALLGAGCRQDMHDAPRIDPLEANAFFADGSGARPLPAGTVARGHLEDDVALYTGMDEGGAFVEVFPIPVDAATLARGRDRFEIYCAVCHDSTGSGRGMIVRRGFKQPPPLYEPRLQAMPAGYLFDVMTRGFGMMSSYAKQVSVADRWAIVAYLRALQLRQSVPLAELSAAHRRELEAATAASDAPSPTHSEPASEPHPR